MSSNSIDLLEVKGLSDFVLTLNTLFMPSSSTFFSLVLKLFDEVFLSPSDFAGKITKAGNGVVGATLLRTKSDYVTRQQTAAATVI